MKLTENQRTEIRRAVVQYANDIADGLEDTPEEHRTEALAEYVGDQLMSFPWYAEADYDDRRAYVLECSNGMVL